MTSRTFNRVTTLGELASIAHELKQPITAAITNAKTCSRWLESVPPDLHEARQAIHRVVKDSTNAADIIDRLRALYKKQTAERELVDINEVIREMLALLRSEASQYPISVRAQLAAALPKTVADRVQLQQVLMNLVLNAIDAMKDEGGELTISSEQTNDGLLRISVVDTGWAFRLNKSIKFSAPSSPRNLRGPVWGSQSLVPSSRHTGAAFGPRPIPGAAQPFISLCRFEQRSSKWRRHLIPFGGA